MKQDTVKKSAKKARLYTNPGILILSINTFVVALGYGLAQPILPFFLMALEGAIDQPPGPDFTIPADVTSAYGFILGILLTGFMSSRTVLSRYFGGLSDTRGRKPLIMGGLLGYCVFFFLLGLSRNWKDLFILRLGLGAASASVWPTVQATMIDMTSDERRGEAMGLNVLAMQFGWNGGPSIGSILYAFCRDVLHLPVPLVFRVPYFLAAVIVLPTIFITYFFLKEPTKAPKMPPTPVPGPVSPEVKSSEHKDVTSIGVKPPSSLDAHTKKQIRGLYVLYIANGISMGLAMPLFTLYLMTRITSDIVIIGFLASGAGMVGMIMNIPAGRLSDTYGRKSIALWSGVASRGAMGALPLTNTLSQATAVYIGRSGAWAVHQPVTRALQGDVTPPRLRGEIFGTLQAFFNFGASVGPLIGGWLFSEYSLTIWHFGSLSIDGIGIPFWLAMISGIIGLIFFAKYITEPRLSPPKPKPLH